MAYKYGTAMVPGSYHYGGGGLGIRGALVPATGVNGPSYLFNDLSLPADADKEVRGLILVPPSAGVWFAYEDGSFSFTGAPDGIYTVPYTLYADGADLGNATITITVGAGSSMSGNANIDTFDANGQIIGELVSDLTGDAILGTFLASGFIASEGSSVLGGNADLSPFVTAGLVAGGQTVNLNQDYPGWVVRSYSRGGSLGRP